MRIICCEFCSRFLQDIYYVLENFLRALQKRQLYTRNFLPFFYRLDNFPQYRSYIFIARFTLASVWFNFCIHIWHNGAHDTWPSVSQTHVFRLSCKVIRASVQILQKISRTEMVFKLFDALLYVKVRIALPRGYLSINIKLWKRNKRKSSISETFLFRWLNPVKSAICALGEKSEEEEEEKIFRASKSPPKGRWFDN